MRRPSHKYLNGWDSVSLLSVGVAAFPPSINQMARPSIVRCPFTRCACADLHCELG